MRKISKSMTSTLSEILILSLLKHKPRYGYELIRTLSELTMGKINRQAGSIYPLLNKMEKKGWIKSVWKVNSERPKKIYHIQKKGITELINQKEDLDMMTNIISRLLKT